MKTILSFAAIFLIGAVAAQQIIVPPKHKLDLGLRITISHFEARIAEGLSALNLHADTAQKAKIENEIHELKNGINAIKALAKDADANKIINGLVQNEIALSHLLQAVTLEEQQTRAKNSVVQILLGASEGLLVRARNALAYHPTSQGQIVKAIVQLQNLVGQIRLPNIADDLFVQVKQLSQQISSLSELVDAVATETRKLHPGLLVSIGHFEARIAEARSALNLHKKTEQKVNIEKEISVLESGVKGIKSSKSDDEAKQIIDKIVPHSINLSQLLMAVTIEEQQARGKNRALQGVLRNSDALLFRARNSVQSFPGTYQNTKIQPAIVKMQNLIGQIRYPILTDDLSQQVKQLNEQFLSLFPILDAVNRESLTAFKELIKSIKA